MSLECYLLKCTTNTGGWIELKKETAVDVFANGIVLREKGSGSLLKDFPRSIISRVEILPGLTVRIHSQIEVEKIGLRFNCENNLELFCQHLQKCCFDYSRKNFTDNSFVNSFGLPKLEDANTQEFILQLLYSEKFKEFVDNMGVLMDELTCGISSVKTRL